MAKQRVITLQEIEFVAYRLAKQKLMFDEPIPDFSTRYPDKLESCLAMPFMRIAGKDCYPSFVDKASMLFYLMIKNRPFKNGNKRIAITTLLVFMLSNNKWIKVNQMEFYNFTIWVASSPAMLKDATVKGIKDFIGKYMVDVEKS